MSRNLTQLGAQVSAPNSPHDAILERVDAPNYTNPFVCRFTCPEFTSLCPVTGQPDFATIIIDYVPDRLLVESKSLKLFLTSFRNHGGFHEEVSNYIADRLMIAMVPKWLRLTALWYPRGGIPIDVFWQSGIPPQVVYIPPIENLMYRGR